MSLPPIAVTAAEGPERAPLLVLGPSLGTSTRLWQHARAGLTERYRVRALDLPGHGDAAPASDAFTIGDLADAVAAAVGDEDFFYAGVSIGGAIGLELLLRHPQRVRAAAIIASGAALGGAPFWQERAELVRSESTSVLVEGSLERWFAPSRRTRDVAEVDALLSDLEQTDDESYARCSEALGSYDVRARLSEIAAPVLALWGEFDEVAPEMLAREIADGVQDGRSERIADAAHQPPAEQPEATVHALRAFFDPLSA